MHGCTKAGIELDRKVLADLAVSDPAAFGAIAEQAKAALEAGSDGGKAAAPGRQTLPPQAAAAGTDHLRDNERLKLVRKLHERRWRDKLGLFVVEGEDLVEAGLGAGIEPVDAARRGRGRRAGAARGGLDARASAARGRGLPPGRPAARRRGR